MKSTILFAPLILLVACATDPEAAADQQVAAAGREEKIVCGMEEPTGSRLRVKRCWTQEQLDRESQDARDVIKRGQLVRPTPKAPGSDR